VAGRGSGSARHRGASRAQLRGTVVTTRAHGLLSRLTAVSRLSVPAQDPGGRLRALGVNPLIAGAVACVAEDALAVASAPRDQGQPATRQVSG